MRRSLSIFLFALHLPVLANGLPAADEAAKLALAAYRAAAEAGDALAANNLGVLLRDGIGVRKDLAEAIDWFKRAAAQGHVKAQLNLAQLYDRLSGKR